MLHKCVPFLLFLTGSLFAAPPGREVIDSILRPAVEEGKVKSMVIGLVDADGRRVYGYAPAGGPAVDGRTVYEIGSITKGFTGLLLAQMVRQGELAIDDRVTKYLPDSVKVQEMDGMPITLLDLATHRSGLPRMPANFAPKDPLNPYADYSVKQMYASLAQYKSTGKAFVYSNLGAGLLGHVMARRAGKSYENLIIERICKPLGMNDTRMTLTGDMRRRLAPPFDAAGKPAGNWDIPTLAGAGALRSTVDDMLNFIEAQIGLRPSSLDSAIAMSHERRGDIGDGGGIALGWHIGAGGVIWHNGQTGGYHSYAAFDTRKRVGVVILSNSATGLVDRLGERCLELALKAAPATQPAK
jgi:CubicO group peptidase (beta-lactamase class C family)